jgi:hypothetical protein
VFFLHRSFGGTSDLSPLVQFKLFAQLRVASQRPLLRFVRNTSINHAHVHLDSYKAEIGVDRRADYIQFTI